MFCGICGHENSNYAKYCIACGKPLIVASNDISNSIYSPTRKQRNPKIRNFWAVLFFTIITFGFYLLYWMYANLREMENSLNNPLSDKALEKALKLFYTIITISILFIIYCILYKPEFLKYNYEYLTRYFFKSPFWQFIDFIISLLFLSLWYFFIKSVKLLQKLRNMSTATTDNLFSFYIIAFILTMIDSYVFSHILVSLSAAIIILVTLYLLQKQINSIWLNDLNAIQSSNEISIKHDAHTSKTLTSAENNLSSSLEKVITSSTQVVNTLYNKTKDVVVSQTDMMRDKQIKNKVMDYIIIRKKLIVAVLFFSLVAFISLFAFKTIESNNSSEIVETDNNTASHDSNISNIDSQSDTNTSLTDFIQLKPSFIVASSTLSSEDNIYIPESAIDDDIETTWVEGASDDGIGQSLTITFDQKVSVSSLEIINGYSKIHNQYGDLYYKNNRIKSILVKFDDDSVTFNLDDGIKDYQRLIPTKNYITRSITITILGIYRGTVANWHDTCLSELKVYGNTHIK